MPFLFSFPQENEVPVVTIDVFNEPSQSTVEFAEFDDGCVRHFFPVLQVPP